MKRDVFRLLIGIILVTILGGCASQVNKVRPDLSLRKETKRILLMPMDIELSSLNAGGLLEPNAEWTKEATQNVRKSIVDMFSQKGLSMHIVQKDDLKALSKDKQDLWNQLVKLHETVGYTVLVNQYLKPFRLPSKKGKFDWGLGKQASFLKKQFDADYALFVYMRDSYATAGRVAVIFVAAVFGIGVPGGQQVGFASLVDLKTGQVVWFNRLMRGVGDLRTKGAAASSVAILLADLPTR